MPRRALVFDMVVCLAIVRAVRGQSFLCSQTASEASDACKFECQHGYERDVALELERLSHENSRCRLNGIIVNLMSSIQFTNRTLARRWFNGDVRVVQLEIDLSNIDIMEPCSFDSDAFRSIVKLTLRRMQIAQLQEDAFERLSELRELYFHELMTRLFIPDWLASVGSTLELLLVFGPGQPTYNLNGLTSDAPMTALRFIHYSLNLNGAIDERTFRGLTSVETLELTGCSIEYIGPGAFDSLGGRLQLLKLDQNRLRQLPAGIFDRLLPSPGLTVFLDSNQWDCRCGLAYLQFVLQAQRETFHGNLRCASPSQVAGEAIETTEFCVNGEDVVFHKPLECLDEDFEKISKSIAYRGHYFRLLAANDQLQVMRVREPTVPWLLVRLSVAGYSIADSNVNDNGRMGCVIGSSIRHLVKPRLTDNWPHLLCMMNKSSTLISPLDCTTYLQRPVLRPRIPWLPNSQKPNIATALAFVMVGCFTVGALAIYTVAAILQKPRTPDSDTSRLVSQGSEEEAYYYASSRNDYAELPYMVSVASRRSSVPQQPSLAFRCLMQQMRAPPQYMPTLQRCNSDPMLVYQSQFDVVPAARSNSLIYVYSSRFDVVPPPIEAKPARRASIASTRY